MAGLKCWLISRRLPEYLDNELREGVRVKVEKHLAECGYCRGALSQLQSEFAAAELMQSFSPPEQFTARVMQRIAEAETIRPARRANPPLSLAWAGWTVVIIAVIAVAAGYFFKPSGQVPTDITGTTTAPTETATATTPLETAQYYEQMGETEEALEAYAEAAQTEETRETALLSMGHLYEEMGFPTAALEAFDAALAMNNDAASTAGRKENES
jgi:tetratricopeptide (TPR) repeat protein